MAPYKYFLEREAKMPSEEELSQWPLKNEPMIAKFLHKFRPVPGNPLPMLAPKQSKNIETITDYYVSPKEIQRLVVSEQTGFTYSDYF